MSVAKQSQARRAIDGILVLDKPAGLSSNAALQRVKMLLRARKAGHTGSLDPAATGLLPLCFGEATKVSAWLLDAHKEYVVRARLGERTDTGDSEGETVASEAVPALDAVGWQQILDGFLGEIEQIPPMYSALKRDGRRLYQLAREGRTVEREPRRITIELARLLALEPGELVIRVRCSKGTYIRTLVEDIAQAAGTVAYTRALRRVVLGPFGSSQMTTLDRLEGDTEEARLGRLLPADSALAGWPVAEVETRVAKRFREGQQVPASFGADRGYLRVYTEQGDFLGIGEAPFPGAVKPKRVFGRH